MFIRRLSLEDENNDSVFLWGARQVGKTTLLEQLYPKARYYDLTLAKEFERFLRRPSLLSEELESMMEGDLVIIDEIQKVPQLLDEIHALIQKKKIRFILSGSSPLKLIRSGANLLGGRALKKILFPLVSSEIPDFNLIQAVNNGLIPRHYIIKNPWEVSCIHWGISKWGNQGGSAFKEPEILFPFSWSRSYEQWWNDYL